MPGGGGLLNFSLATWKTTSTPLLEKKTKQPPLDGKKNPSPPPKKCSGSPGILNEQDPGPNWKQLDNYYFNTGGKTRNNIENVSHDKQTQCTSRQTKQKEPKPP